MRTLRVPEAADLIRLEVAGVDRFHGHSPLRNHNNATFGGLLLGQSLAAAAASVESAGRWWPATSLSGFFLRPGSAREPLEIAVERTGDSRRFAARRVVVSQGGKAVFILSCTFSGVSGGVEHQSPALRVDTGPDDLLDIVTLIEEGRVPLPAWLNTRMFLTYPIVMRPVSPTTFFDDDERAFWMRMPSAAGLASPADHQALLALISDYWLAGVATAPHARVGPRFGAVSLNHAMWLHRPARVDDWLLYRTDSHWAGSRRGLARGMILDRAGQLVATVIQEALIEEIA
jgi:acyl-CoA thioesterase II